MHSKYVHPIVQRVDYLLRYSKDFKCYVVIERMHGLSFPSAFYLGERCLYTTPGTDHMAGGGFRGNLSDSWPCNDFGMDLLSALKWLWEAEEPERTLELWTSNPEF